MLIFYNTGAFRKSRAERAVCLPSCCSSLHSADYSPGAVDAHHAHSVSACCVQADGSIKKTHQKGGWNENMKSTYLQLLRLGKKDATVSRNIIEIRMKFLTEC